MSRDSLLYNAGEDTIHSNEITLKTGKQKRQNWWYYNRFRLLAAAVAIGLIASFVYSIVSKVEPDYTVALVTSYTMPESGRKELERCIEAYADDRNGDGQVRVTVANYAMSDDPTTSQDAQAAEAEFVKLTADFTTNESMIFLHDESAFKAMTVRVGASFNYNDGTPMADGDEDYENAMYQWSEVKAFADFVPEGDPDTGFTSEVLSKLYSGLRMSFRSKEGSSIERKEKTLAYYDASQKLYDRLLAGEKTESGES